VTLLRFTGKTEFTAHMLLSIFAGGAPATGAPPSSPAGMSASPVRGRRLVSRRARRVPRRPRNGDTGMPGAADSDSTSPTTPLVGREPPQARDSGYKGSSTEPESARGPWMTAFSDAVGTYLTDVRPYAGLVR
jgi:hypothetical protein